MEITAKDLDEITIYGNRFKINSCLYCRMLPSKLFIMKDISRCTATKSYYWAVWACEGCLKRNNLQGNNLLLGNLATIKELFYLEITGKLDANT